MNFLQSCQSYNGVIIIVGIGDIVRGDLGKDTLGEGSLGKRAQHRTIGAYL